MEEAKKVNNMEEEENKRGGLHHIGEKEQEEQDLVLPGFRFHPTDEELIGFYLRWKVAGRVISIEIIKEVDIYKYDPWDLSKLSTVGVGDKEWYFYCLRGRKYRNSIRPNRVTGSGFWKATGIDRPIYSTAGGSDDCIGLKKSLVYYLGSAGKGSKTDWMMHEFRLPPKTSSKNDSNANTNGLQEVENWTICRIFKRNVSFTKKYTQELKDKRIKNCSTPTDHSLSPNSCSIDSDSGDNYKQLGASMFEQNEKKPEVIINWSEDYYNSNNQWINTLPQVPVASTSNINTNPSFPFESTIDALQETNWDELVRLMDSTIDSALVYGYT